MTVIAFELPGGGPVFLLVGLVLLIASGAMRDFVWADLKEGAVRVKGLDRTTRVLAWLGIALLVALVLAVLFTDQLRTLFDLSAAQDGTPGRGTLLPRPLLPVTMFLLGIACTLILTGALHMHRGLRVALLLFYLAVASEWAFSATSVNASPGKKAWILAAMAAVPVFFALRWRAKPRPLFEFGVLLVPVTISFALAQDLVLSVDKEFGGVPLAFTQASITIVSITTFALPFIFFIGLDIAEFGYRVSGWTVEIARSKVGTWAPAVALAVLGVWRAATVITQLVDRVSDHGFGEAARGYFGAFVVLLVVVGAWYAFVQRPKRELAPLHVSEASKPAGVALVFAFFMPLVVIQAAVMLSQGAITAGIPGFTMHTIGRLVDMLSWYDDHTFDYRSVVALGAIGLAWYLASRGKRGAAMFLGSVSGVVLWAYVTSPNKLLESVGQWNTDRPYLQGVLFAGVVLCAGVWLATGRLTPVRIDALLFLTALIALVGHLDFLEDPFSTEFAVAGAFIVVFSIAFDVVSAGSWANETSSALPRASRLLTYLGYVIFTLVLVNWSLVTHDIESQQLYTGLGAQFGFELVGEPMLLGIGVLVLVAAMRGRDAVGEQVEPTFTTF